MKLHVGTSGYSYKEWKGNFYPEDLPAKEMLSYYSRRLPAVEINNTFYRLPQPSMIENWNAQVPGPFRFSIKATQRITHIKRLNNVADETKYLLETASLLEQRLGVVLFQLPPNFKKDVERLKAFLDLLNPVGRFRQRQRDLPDRALQPRQVRGIVDQHAVQHGGDFVDAVGEQKPAVENRDFGISQWHERTVDVSDLIQASSPVGAKQLR